MADQKPDTTNPSNNAEVNPSIMPLMIKVNNPSDIIFIGKVSTRIIGLIEIFNKPKITDAINKSLNSLKIMPEKIKLATPSDNEFINQRIITFLNKL